MHLARVLSNNLFALYTLVTGVMSLTTLAIAAAAQQAAGPPAGVHKSFQMLLEDALSQYTRLSLLDEVFKGFIQTNKHQGRHYSVEDLLSIDHKQGFFFEHHSIPYLATVDLHRGPDIDWLTIKLCNSSFHYIAKLGPLISRPNSESWVALEADHVMQQFPFLSAAANTFYDTARLFYNYQEKRLDMKLYPRSAATPGLMVTFEPGYPYMDDLAPMGDIP